MSFQPACMAPDELTLWQDANRIAPVHTRASVPCIDCPLSFASEMRAKGCCNGRPKALGRPILEVTAARRRRLDQQAEYARRYRARLRAA